MISIINQKIGGSKMKNQTLLNQVIKELLENFEYLNFNTIIKYCDISGLTSHYSKLLVYQATVNKIKYL